MRTERNQLKVTRGNSCRPRRRRKKKDDQRLDQRCHWRQVEKKKNALGKLSKISSGDRKRGLGKKRHNLHALGPVGRNSCRTESPGTPKQRGGDWLSLISLEGGGRKKLSCNEEERIERAPRREGAGQHTPMKSRKAIENFSSGSQFNTQTAQGNQAII